MKNQIYSQSYQPLIQKLKTAEDLILCYLFDKKNQYNLKNKYIFYSKDKRSEINFPLTFSRKPHTFPTEYRPLLDRWAKEEKQPILK